MRIAVSLILRTLRKNKFDVEQQPNWVPEGDLQADALFELKVEDNALSVYQISDDLSDLERVLAAIAATREHLANIDFALLDSSNLTRLGITARNTPGNVPDLVVKGLHLDLVHLTVLQLAELAIAIMQSAKLERRTMSKVRSLLLDSIERDYIDSADLKEGVREKLT